MDDEKRMNIWFKENEYDVLEFMGECYKYDLMPYECLATFGYKICLTWLKKNSKTIVYKYKIRYWMVRKESKIHYIGYYIDDDFNTFQVAGLFLNHSIYMPDGFERTKKNGIRPIPKKNKITGNCWFTIDNYLYFKKRSVKRSPIQRK